MKEWFVYILECSDGTLYTGITTDVLSRMKKHNAGMGAAYTRGRTPLRVIYSENAKNRSEAQVREHLIKGWSREKKLNLIKYGKPVK